MRKKLLFFYSYSPVEYCITCPCWERGITRFLMVHLHAKYLRNNEQNDLDGRGDEEAVDYRNGFEVRRYERSYVDDEESHGQ